MVDDPMPRAPHDVTELLQAWGDGDKEALAKLVPLVYRELRRIAGRQLGRERRDHTLEPTALVHEAYMRLAGHTHPKWKGRVQFYTVAAELMRRILVDHARSRAAVKRGGGALKVSLTKEPVSVQKEIVSPGQQASDIIAIDEGLEALAKIDARKSRVIELRYFGGLTIEEAAEALNVSSQTVINDTRAARAWLFSFLNTGQATP